MNHFNKYKIKNFQIAGGYKVEMIKEYFMNFNYLNNDFEINYKKRVKYYKKDYNDWNVGMMLA